MLEQSDAFSSKFMYSTPVAACSSGFWEGKSIEMATTHLLLNDQPVTITAEASEIKKLNEDDQHLAEYINRAAKMGQFGFLFKNQPALKKIVVRRMSLNPPLKPVWYKKGRPSDNDHAAAALLLKLRGSEKYILRFKDAYVLRNTIWDEIASEMRAGGYDVDGSRCSQKFLNLAQGYYKYKQFVESCTCSYQKIFPPEFYFELHKILGDEKEKNDDDDEWLPRNKLSIPNNNKRKRAQAASDDDENEFFKKFLKQNCEQKEERFKHICNLIDKRNEIMTEKLKQNEKIINLLEKLANKN